MLPFLFSSFLLTNFCTVTFVFLLLTLDCFSYFKVFMFTKMSLIPLKSGFFRLPLNISLLQVSMGYILNTDRFIRPFPIDSVGLHILSIALLSVGSLGATIRCNIFYCMRNNKRVPCVRVLFVQ